MSVAIGSKVILDTDIGGDIDDSWALIMMLNSPELDPVLVLSATGDTLYRAKLAARILRAGGRTEIPIGIGVKNNVGHGHDALARMVENERIEDYPGQVYEDGVGTAIEMIMNSSEPITLISIGPLSNIAEALRREPAIAGKINFVGMHGSFHLHHRTNLCCSSEPGAIAEYNVVLDIPAAQQVFDAPWKTCTITPLDTCGDVMLDGERYRRIKDKQTPMLKELIDCYRQWSPRNAESNPEKHSSVLFDTVAVHLAYSQEFLEMKALRMKVDDRGFTVSDDGGKPVNVAMKWLDKEGFLDELTRRLENEQ